MVRAGELVVVVDGIVVDVVDVVDVVGGGAGADVVEGVVVVSSSPAIARSSGWAMEAPGRDPPKKATRARRAKRAASCRTVGVTTEARSG